MTRIRCSASIISTKAPAVPRQVRRASLKGVQRSVARRVEGASSADFRRTSAGGFLRYTGRRATQLRSTSMIELYPTRARVRSISSLIIATTSDTPASPFAESPYKVARPSITAVAPNATAFTTSAPLRMPLSRMRSVVGVASEMPGNASIGAGRSASCRPP